MVSRWFDSARGRQAMIPTGDLRVGVSSVDETRMGGEGEEVG